MFDFSDFAHFFTNFQLCLVFLKHTHEIAKSDSKRAAQKLVHLMTIQLIKKKSNITAFL